MNIVGIVTEYNPFHNGHAFHAAKSKSISQSKYVIAVMSGNYVQRGEPALLDKWARTKMALLNGVDLVIELPTIYSCASAEYFSMAAVQLLNSTKIVTHLCFGSESSQINMFQKAADILSQEPLKFQMALKENLSQGISFPLARAKGLQTLYDIPEQILYHPNNILGVEYCKALQRLQSSILPLTITRNQNYHSLEIGPFASASAIRNAVQQENFSEIMQTMPQNAFDILSEQCRLGAAPITLNAFSASLNYILRKISAKELAEILDVTEGLENKILKASDTCFTISEMTEAAKSKRYTYTKIQRALLHLLLEIQKKDFLGFFQNNICPYIRVLGFRRDTNILSALCDNASIPVVTSVKKALDELPPLGQKLLSMECKFTDIYFMASPNPAYRKQNQELTRPMIIL